MSMCCYVNELPVKRPQKKVSDSKRTTSDPMFPGYINNSQIIFGGRIMSSIDKLAYMTAKEHAEQEVVTLSAYILFHKPVYPNYNLVLKSSVNYVGKTSMEVGVRVEAENSITGDIYHANTAYLTMVAIDQDKKSVIVPELVTKTYDEIRRRKEARQRLKILKNL
ncbi:acyl-CoA thioesterase [Methanobacterium sp.]|uniref:acyl-CoA thioesterase n=1 Tax=Methanobacterium sp. TaxID=2164 RepID=UPI003C717FEC